LSAGGVLLTVLLCFIGKKQQETHDQQIGLGSFRLFGYGINIVLFLCLFRVAFMVGDGLFSAAGLVVLVGACAALIPLVVTGLILWKNHRIFKEQD
jgi:hypothetical protein